MEHVNEFKKLIKTIKNENKLIEESQKIIAILRDKEVEYKHLEESDRELKGKVYEAEQIEDKILTDLQKVKDLTRFFLRFVLLHEKYLLFLDFPALIDLFLILSFLVLQK